MPEAVARLRVIYEDVHMADEERTEVTRRLDDEGYEVRKDSIDSVAIDRSRIDLLF